MRHTTGPARAVAAALLVSGALAGCASADPPVDPDRSTTDDIATYRFDGSAMEALLTGTLVSRDGCVYVETAGDDGAEPERWLPFFPEQTTVWDGTTLTLGVDAYELGDEVSLGGGVSSQRTSPEDLSGMDGLPAACDPVNAWLVGPPARNEG